MANTIEVSALTMYNLERYLEKNKQNLEEGKPLEVEPFRIIPARKISNFQKKREALAERYGLSKRAKMAPYSADEDVLYERICELYPFVREHFANFKKLTVAMTYGNAPCVTYTAEEYAELKKKEGGYKVY